MALKDRLKQAMEEAGVKAPWLIKELGVTKATVYWWLDGTIKELSGDNLLKVAKVLGVKPEWLGEGRGPMRDAPEEKPRAIRPKELEISEAIKDLDDEDLGDILKQIIKARNSKELEMLKRTMPTPTNNSGPDASAA